MVRVEEALAESSQEEEKRNQEKEKKEESVSLYSCDSSKSTSSRSGVRSTKTLKKEEKGMERINRNNNYKAEIAALRRRVKKCSKNECRMKDSIIHKDGFEHGMTFFFEGNKVVKKTVFHESYQMRGEW